MSRNAFAQCEREYNETMQVIDNARAERLAAEIKAAAALDDDEPWRCSGCGEEIDHEGLCEDCTPEVEDEYDGFCTTCCGTGEGMYDGARCSACKGKGVIPKPDDFDDFELEM